MTVLLVPGTTCGGMFCMCSKCPAPGSRKSSGETLFEALMPLQPASSDNRLPQPAPRTIFQFNLTVNHSIDTSITFATPIYCARICLAGCLTSLAGIGQTVADAAATEPDLATYAKRSFQEAKARYREEPDEGSAAWQFGRACFDLAEFATNSTQRSSLAEQGIAAARLAIARQSNSAPAHYYLAMNLGQLARTKMLGALKLVGQMEREFGRARDLDEHLDCAGPDRNLGQLYRDAPVIGSVGSRTRARERLKRAVELAPEYPENRLTLIEAYLKWGERAGASCQLQFLEGSWPAARTNFVGEAWAAKWADWEPRLKMLKKKIEGPTKSLDAPREKD
jgi:tetratricopeptide (TPR) repeat protein